MQQFTAIQKILFAIALVFLYFAYSGGFTGLSFLFAFAASIFAIAFIERKKGVNFKHSLYNVLGFFEKLGVPLALCVFISTSVIFVFLLFGTTVENVSKVPYMHRAVFLMILTAPFFEETLFRGIILNYSKKILEKLMVSRAELFALLFSSALFGFAHTYGLVNSVADIGLILATFSIGIILGRQFLKEGLISAIWLHGIYNLIVFLVNYAAFWVNL